VTRRGVDPPHDDACTPTEIEIVDDVLVVGGENLVFARFCDEQ
jgi:hypothetical protein